MEVLIATINTEDQDEEMNLKTKTFLSLRCFKTKTLVTGTLCTDRLAEIYTK